MGWVKYHLNDLEEAEKRFLKAVELNPDSADVRIGLGWVYYKWVNSRKECLKDAEREFGRAIELNPAAADAYVGMGWVMFRHEWDGHRV